MLAVDQALYLLLNLSASAPHWLVLIAYASSNYLMPALITATVATALFGRAPWRGAAWRVLLAVILASVLAATLKHALALPRPGAFDLGMQWMSRRTAEGFPSSHAAVALSWALAASLAPLRNGMRALFLLAAVLVSWSRVALGLHFPSQILGGWALAVGCMLAAQEAFTYADRVLAPRVRDLARRLGRHGPL